MCPCVVMEGKILIFFSYLVCPPAEDANLCRFYHYHHSFFLELLRSFSGPPGRTRQAGEKLASGALAALRDGLFDNAGHHIDRIVDTFFLFLEDSPGILLGNEEIFFWLVNTYIRVVLHADGILSAACRE